MVETKHLNGKGEMKTAKRTVIGAIVVAMLAMSRAHAGELDPTNGPAPTMHTLEEIYQELLTTKQELAALRASMGADGMADVVNGMVLVPSGDFVMGDTFYEAGTHERPLHTVTVSALYMDQYEVTKAKWDEVANWAATNGYDIAASDGDGKEASHPVYNVTWYECVKWANARSEMEDRTPCYYTQTKPIALVYRTGKEDLSNTLVAWTANGYRLPTEAEWEKAARGGATGRRFPWAGANTIQHTRANYVAAPASYSYDTSATTGYHPDYSDASEPHTSPVGAFAPNGYGLYDMAGNIREWCWDGYEHAYYSTSPGTDPRGPGSNEFRVNRGGDWVYHAEQCRIANRGNYRPNTDGYSLGFRLVRSAP